MNSMSSLELIQLHQKFLINFLKGNFGKNVQYSKQIIQLILSFLFASPFKQKNIFVLKSGICRIQYKNMTFENEIGNQFALKYSNQQIIALNRSFKIKQNNNFLIGNKFYLNQRVKITKIWLKPATKTEKKILTYCGKFKQFLLGKHHLTKIIDLRYLNRQFLISDFQKDEFEKDFKNIEQNDPNFCSFDVLDSYMSLVTKNYIQIELAGTQFNDDRSNKYKVISQESEIDFLKGIQLIFNKSEKQWEFKGQNIKVWKQQQVFSRNKELFRTIDGKVDLAEGANLKIVQQIEYSLQ